MSENRLAKEKSPYLLQHAHNPVDWFPWGEDAFRKARGEDKPVLLSIGYSTCHWCHVMEEESFENAETAELMNRHFVPVKVDREERPDIDKIYMSYVMASTGSGGWPMTVFLTPGLKPFFGGTYFPPEDRFGMPGFKRVLLHMAEAWQKDKDKILKSGEGVARFLSEQGRGEPGSLTLDVLHGAFQAFFENFDAVRGGFGGAPKFPTAHALTFLLRYHHRTRQAEALEMVEKTLTEMAAGGLYDQIGGGFHRYSVDAEWRVPHFEKMLYDQAMLLRAYAEAYQATRKDAFAVTARETADYVLRDMRSPEGAFYSAEDADSPIPSSPGKKREGAFTVWSASEIRSLAGPDAQAFAARYGVEESGNVSRDPQGEFEGQNVLYDKMPHEPREGLAAARRKLFEARSRRPRPHLDDKILTDWNGLMIGALALASRSLSEPRYRDAARGAAEFILSRVRDGQGRLLHRHRDGESAIRGQLDDHAFLAWGLLSLYEATFEERWLGEAKRLADEMTALFWDGERGGFFMTAADGDAFLIARPKEITDGAVPSGNSVAARVLLALGSATGDRRYRELAEKTLAAFAESASRTPTAFAEMLSAADYAFGPSSEIVIAARDEAEAGALLREVFSRFVPNRVVLLRREGSGRALEALAPFTREKGPVGGRPAAYVCHDRTCQLPVTEPLQLRELLLALI